MRRTSRSRQERPHIRTILVRTNNHHTILLRLLLLVTIVLVLAALHLDFVRGWDTGDDTVLAPRMRVFLDSNVRVDLCVLCRVKLCDEIQERQY